MKYGNRTKVPRTKAPLTKVPRTKAPLTKVPQTKAPLTKVPRTKAPRTKAPHNEIIIQSYYIFFYIDDDIKDILKIKTHPY